MTYAKKTLIYNVLYVAIAVAIVLAVWSVAAAAANSEFVLPNIGQTLRAFPGVFSNPEFWRGLSGTLLRSVISYAISTALFFVTFYFATAYGVVAKILTPIISALRSLPAVAVTLILILALGGNGAPILLGVIVIYPILYSSAAARTATVPRELVEISRLCGATKAQTFFAVYLPCLAGGLPESLSSAFSYNIKAVIGAEILAQTASSIGMLMKLSQIYLQPATLVAFVVTAVAVAVAAEIAMRAVLGLALSRFADR